MRRFVAQVPLLASLAAIGVLAAGCPAVSEYDQSQATDFPRLNHTLMVPGQANLPLGDNPTEWQHASGVIGQPLTQPIAFPHYRHVTELGIQCQYCHVAARKSIHAGVPNTSTCMNCHTYVAKDKPEIQKLTEFWKSGQPIPWKKVHDLPDFVHFAHKRHVNAGVNCTECHGEVGLQGQKSTWVEPAAEGSGSHEGTEVTGVRYPMVRETSLQMGWCLDCHATHPSIDKNYGDKADLRRAELKDCWTCHK